MSNTYFVTGISTHIGKTVISAILTEALQADYWKPVQAGDLDNTDTHKLKRWVTNDQTNFHESAYDLVTPMSPHAAAEIDGIQLAVEDIKRPKTKNDLVIEGCGGLLVPFNNKQTLVDLIDKGDKVVVVSQHYLGSINHTLLTIEALKARDLNIFGIIFNGNEHPTTESVIREMTGVPILGRIDAEPYVDAGMIREYAERFREVLKSSKS
ncbi:MAG: dethiobiotin synthase [Bacteroidota bacterium]